MRVDSFRVRMVGQVTKVIPAKTTKGKEFRWVEIEQLTPQGFSDHVRVRVINGAKIEVGKPLDAEVAVIVEKGDQNGRVYVSRIVF